MNSNGITMNYTFQSHYYVFYLICPTDPQRRALHDYLLCYGNSHRIFLNKGGMLFVKYSFLREIWRNMFCFVLVWFCFNGTEGL